MNDEGARAPGVKVEAKQSADQLVTTLYSS